ncbi:MAG: hypothetical protein AB1896_18290 [Thermodesulfobacteriota bacterium]
MSKREKIIIALMAAAMLYGGYELLFGSRPSATTPGPSTEEVAAFVAEMSGLLAAKSPALAHAPYILSRASAEWQKDPFAGRELVALYHTESKVREEESAEAVPVILGGELGLAYTGFLQSGENALAIINGLEYEVGDRLDGPEGYLVKAISPEQVEVAREGLPNKIIIPLEEPEF